MMSPVLLCRCLNLSALPEIDGAVCFLQGLKSEIVDYKAATYMILSQLAVKVVMLEKLVDSLAVHVSKSLGRGPALTREGLSCLIVLLQNQKEGVVGPK